MKESTQENRKTPSPLSILLIGPPGGGKTTLAMQFPDVLFMDCDENMDGPETLIRKGSKDFPANPSLRYRFESIRRDKNDLPLPIEKCFDRLIECLDSAQGTDARTVVTDNLTHVNEFIIRKIIAAQRRTEMEMRDWIPFKSLFYSLIVSKLRHLGKHSICTVHETIMTEPDPRNLMNVIVKGYRPSVQGSIVDFFGSFFTDVWRCEARLSAGNKVRYFVVTARTAYSDLKNSMSLPSEIEVTNGAANLLTMIKDRL